MVAVWFNQPWLARQLGEGTALLLHGKLRRGNQFWVTEHEVIGGRRCGRRPHARARPGLSGEPGDHAGAAAHAHVGGVGPDRRRGRAAAGPAARGGGAGGAPGRARGRPLSRTSRRIPDEARHRLAFEELFLLELALAGRKRARAERARARELARHRRAGRPMARSTSRSSSTSDQRRAFERIDGDIAAATPMQRLLMGEVGQREDGGRPGTRCCAPSRAARRPRSWRPPRRSPSSTWRRSTGCSAGTCRSGC